MKIKSKFWKAILLLSVWMVSVPLGFATVDWEILNTLQLEAAPLDVAISPDGKSVFVLTNDGSINIYSVDGRFRDKIEVGKQIDQIKLGPTGERLFAASRKSKTVKVISLDFADIGDAAHEFIEESDNPGGVLDGLIAIPLGSGGERVSGEQVPHAHF